MDKNSATTLITQTFNTKFNVATFQNFVANLLNNVDRSKAFGSRSGNYIKQKFRRHVSTYKRPFVYYDPNGDRLDVLIVRLHKESNLERARTMQRNFAADYLKKESAETIEAALIAFYHEDVDDWRFSFVKLDYAFGEDGIEEKLTPARRYSFLVGPTEPTHTAEEQLRPFLINDNENPTIESLTAAFQIESVSKKFFEEYKGLFLRLVEGVEAVIRANKRLAADFERADIYVPNFSKKLLGQIVFLYFVQKKGWLGVAADTNRSVDRKWGSGPKNFLRRLFEKKEGVAYDNFFNDVLEPLFYDALAVRREGDLFTIGDCTCKIPFLNGGLFEPMGGYDWAHTNLLLPNSLFSERQDAADDSGMGILDVFDRYNFTVWEEEPLEKEVAVDPEMLGKVFENLLDVQDRKSKGAFYTPREIVHYMCQESLINYLDTAMQAQTLRVSETLRVSREEIGVLVRQGALALQHDAAKEAGLKKDAYMLPASVRAHAAALDAALQNIKICDSAIGSGAFPVGMLHEIVQARRVLGTYLGQPQPPGGLRTPYQLKRHAIQESIYGVDIDAGAVEIAKLRLWLSLVVDEESYDNIQPLPNLDYKIVCGNSLLGVEKNLFNVHLFTKLDKLKRKFFEETHRQEKIRLKAQIDQLIELITDGNSTFDFEVYFHEVFAEQDGFDMVIGNPPYVRMELFKDLKPILKKTYPKVYSGRADLYVYFYVRGLEILRLTGTLAFISSNKFMRAKYGEKLRKLLGQQTSLCSVIDFGDLPVFDATAYPSIIITRQCPPHDDTELHALTVETLDVLQRLPQEVDELAWLMPQKAFKPTGWALASPEVLRVMQKIQHQSTPLGKYLDGKFYYGIKTGYNAAFVIDNKIRQRLIDVDKRSSEVIKPWLRGRDVNKWHVNYTNLYVIFMPHGIEVEQYPAIENHLHQFKEKLENRATSHLHPWYEMQQPQMGCYFEYEKSKIVYPDIAKHPAFAYDESGTYITNTLYVIPTDEKFLLGILNSNVVHFFYSQISSQVRGDYLRFVAQYVSQIPVPDIPTPGLIESLVIRILKAKKANPIADVAALEAEIDQLVYQLYGLSAAEIAIVEGAVNG